MSLESTFAEFHDRTRRSMNIMVYNLKGSEETDVNKNIQHDLLNKLFPAINPNVTLTGIKAYRVGQKQQNKSRPLKVILTNAADVVALIGKFKTDSVDPLFSSVKLSIDRTPREIKHLQTLNAKLIERTSRGETGVRTALCPPLSDTIFIISHLFPLIFVHTHTHPPAFQIYSGPIVTWYEVTSADQSGSRTRTRKAPQGISPVLPKTPFR
ncbi:hypothetical protein J6590_080337 [Homalodisca vitripennis]|nr:hypothetical protein J6590_080337 [Homalodisca vitripennis]